MEAREKRALEQIRTWIDDLNSGVAVIKPSQVLELIQGEVNGVLDSPTKDAPDAWLQLVGNLALKRALEVALAGDHSVTVVGHPDNGLSHLRKVAPAARFIQRCPCGWFQDAMHECWCKPNTMQKYIGRKQYQYALDSQILVELVSPRPRDLESNQFHEPYADMLARTERAKAFAGSSDQSLELDNESKQLLERAAVRLGFTPPQVKAVRLVARTIANLESSDNIRSPHLAEALGYQTLKHEIGSGIR